MLTTIFIVFGLCFAVERLVPGWPLPRVRTWPLRVLLVNGVQLAIVLLAGISWERWLSAASVFSLSEHVSPVLGGLFAYFIATFVFYWWHRWRHEIPLLWRGFHQIHHSPQRLEVITSFYKHPGEMIVNSIIGSLLVYTLLGLSLEAGAIYTIVRHLVSSSITPTSAPRAGSDSFSSARKCIASITSMAAIGTTTETSCGGTCCSVPMRTQRSGGTPVDSTTRKNSSC